MKKRLILFFIIFLLGICLIYIKISRKNLWMSSDKQTESFFFNQDIKSADDCKKVIDIDEILQNPELPTGCEVTSLAMVLNYWGYDIDKLTLATDYLKKGEIGSVNFKEAFVGDPRSAEAYGCYVEVIVDCAHNYLSDVSSLMQVTNVSGSELSDLYAYIQQDIPVIVWTTIDLVEPVYTTEWVINGETLKWLSNEHCVVLTGYNQEENVVYAADPLKGNVTYDASLFEQRYNQLFSQAVIIN